MKKLKRENSDERVTIFHCHIPRNDNIMADIVNTFKHLTEVEIKSVIISTCDKDLNYMDITVTLPDNETLAAYKVANRPETPSIRGMVKCHT